MSEDQSGIESDPGSTGGAATTTGRGRGGVVGWVIAALLLALLAASVVFAVTQVRAHDRDQAADKDRSRVLSVAEQFTIRLDALDYRDLDGYTKKVTALLTPKMKADFNSSFTGFDQAFAQVQLVSKGEVKAAGISDIDDDSATVLVIHDVDVTTKGCAQPPYKRMKVELRKVSGKWLVDDFAEGVPGCQGQSGASQ